MALRTCAGLAHGGHFGMDCVHPKQSALLFVPVRVWLLIAILEWIAFIQSNLHGSSYLCGFGSWWPFWYGLRSSKAICIALRTCAGLAVDSHFGVDCVHPKQSAWLFVPVRVWLMVAILVWIAFIQSNLHCSSYLCGFGC